MIEMHVATGCGMVASEYADSVGGPALFTANYYPALVTLAGDRGARELFLKYPNDLATVPFPLGAVDIDTAADLQALVASVAPAHR